MNDAGQLPADPRDICPAEWRAVLPSGPLLAIYFGSEFCIDLLPDGVKAARLCGHARDAGMEGVLLTPVVTSAGLARIKQLLTGLSAAGESPAVVFNDWGVANLLRESFPQLPSRAGRLMNRGLRDPRLMEKEAAPTNTGVRGRRMRSLLARFGVAALETDPDLEGGYLGDGSEGLQRVLHLPYAFAASSRNCLVKSEAARTMEECFTKGLGLACSGVCRGQWHRIVRSDTRLPLWRAGNTIFFEIPHCRAAVHIEQADRIVLHERPTA